VQIDGAIPARPGEDWWFCYIDDLGFTVDGAPSYEHP
jgi:hypothetical protein